MRLLLATLLVFLCTIPCSLLAQNVAVHINVTTDSLRPINKAKITLSTGKEKPVAATTAADGKVTVSLQPSHTYLLDIDAPGYAAFSSSLYVDSTHTSFSYRLRKTQALQGTTVTAARPLMRQDGDMTVVDPEQLVPASTSSYEVLEKTPGIVADQDGNFYLSSATAATIYINGREMKMSSADIAAMLKALPPNTIQRIEILRTPSAKYDASGGGGIINIVLKKGVKLGLTGSINVGAQQGVYGNQNIGGNVSYGDGDLSAYVNVNLAKRKSLEHINSTRELAIDTLLSQDANSVYDGENVYLGYGVSKSVKEKWELSYDGRMSGNWNDNSSNNESFINQKTTAAPVSDNLTNTTNRGSNWSVNQSVDTKYKIDTSGSEWTMAATWNGAFGNNNQDILSRFIIPVTSDITNDGSISTARHYLMLQSDLKYKLHQKLQLEAGVKATASIFHHSSDYNIEYNGTVYQDPLRSTTYRYNENINALYGQATKQWGNVILKAGARIENTNMDGAQTRPGDTSFSIHRTDAFPYVYLSKPVMKIADFELRAYLVYRRTIARPTYEYLNPFQRFVDQYLYEAGNPNLRPQFTSNYEFNISADEHPVFAIGYNDIKDVYTQVVYQSEVNKNIALRTYDNLGSNKELYVRGMGGVPPGGAYFFILGGQYNVVNYDGYYNGAPLQYRRESFTFFTYHNLKLGKNTNIVVNGFMRLRGMMQFYELGTFGALNASINHNFLDKKLAVTLSVQDMFYTNRYDATINQTGIVGDVSRYNDSRRIGINVRYNFGFKKKEESKDFPGEEGEKPAE
jgi:hypothetical protein